MAVEKSKSASAALCEADSDNVGNFSAKRAFWRSVLYLLTENKLDYVILEPLLGSRLQIRLSFLA